MIQNLNKHERESLHEALAKCGQKITPQRELGYTVLLAQRDHPTVDEVYNRALETMPGLSLATVYNCLETFVGCGLVRQVNHERESTRYCPNLAPHAHFRDESTGRVHDIELPKEILDQLTKILPANFETETIEISFQGRTKSSTQN